MYENRYWSRRLVVYGVLSKREILDNTLQELEILRIEDIKYISFKNTSSNNKVRALYLNNITNIKVRFKTLKNTNVLEVTEYEGKKGSLREILLRIKYNKTHLFVGVE